jgi:hypothetical protein
LSDIQAAFQRHIMTQDPAIATHIVSNERLDGDQRLAVYANAYRARLVEALAADYPALQGNVSQDEFTELCHAYIRAYPSTCYSLRDFGQHLPEFLRQGYPEHLSELARFEWALTTSFDAEDAEVASVQAATELSAAAWPSVRIRVHPSVSQLELGWNTLALWRNVKEGRPMSLPERLPEPMSCLIWRDGLTTRYRSVDPDESAAFHAARSGGTFADLCGQLTSSVPQSQVALRAASLLKTWLASGIVSELVT